ncbi:MAG: hypothetical protein IKC28_01580 [Clostridia bacterium]|nr:hypothetical protein [Clostridia bacterium]
MAKQSAMGGRLGNVIKNSSLGLINNVLPSILRFLSRYIFIIYFGDALLGVNSLFGDVVLLFSFAEMGIFSAISYFLYKPIAEEDHEKAQSLLALYRKFNIAIIVMVSVVGLGFLPFLNLIKVQEPIPNLWMYYLVFLAQNILSYFFSYRTAYLTAAQKAYQVSHISIITSVVSIVLQIVVTIVTRNFLAYLLTDLLLNVVKVFWTNHYIMTHYPQTKLVNPKPLDAASRKQFFQKTKSLFAVRLANLGISQTDSIIVSTMVDVVQWGYVSNYLSIKKIGSMALSAFSMGMLPSLGNLTAIESREKQIESFNLYSFFSAWLYLNFFAGFVILVPPFVAMTFGEIRVLDDLTCFLLFFNVLYNGLLEAVTILRDARGLYQEDLGLTIAAFFGNLVASIILVRLFGLPGVFAGTIIGTTIMYGRPYVIWREVFGEKNFSYYRLALVTIVEALVAYAILQFVLVPLVWNWQSNLFGLILLAVITVAVTNLVFLLMNLRNPQLKNILDLVVGRFIKKKQA